MLRSATSVIMLVAWTTILLPFGCSTGPPPDDRQFIRDVVQMVVEAAKRPSGTGAGDLTKTVVFDKDSIPSDLSGVENAIKNGLDDAGISWVDADLQGDARNLPGEWTTFGRDSTLKFNRTHSVVHLIVEGDGRQREVEWGYVCGPVCGYGQRVRLEWTGRDWSHTTVADIRY